MKGLRAGTMTTAEANAISKGAGKTLARVKAAMKAARLIQRTRRP